MIFRSLRARIAVSYAVLISVALLGIAFYVLGYTRNSYVENLTRQLTDEAWLVAEIARPALQRRDPDQARELAARVYELTGVRVTVISVDGEVWADSASDPATMPNHLYRPEIQQALRDGKGVTSRYSQTVEYEMLYVAVPVREGNQLLGFARVALALDAIDRDVARLRRHIALAAATAVAAALLLAFVLAEATTRSVRELSRAAQRMAEGDLNVHLLPHTRDEVGDLTRDMATMAARLRDTIEALQRERAESMAILDHMADGIIITDAEGRIRMINPSAARMLGLENRSVAGRSFAQVVRDHQIIGVLQDCLREGAEQVALVDLGQRGPLLQVIATPLQKRAEVGGCLVVCQDLGQVRRLETIRREFVSNISHELRTPLASLRALTDTLREGALEDRPAALRFLDRMDAEVDAMTQMVRELLELSRIESGQVPMALAPTAVSDVIQTAVERMRPQAERAELTLEVFVPDDLPTILADAERLGQVLTNILHNAIKYTPAGGVITIRAALAQDRVIISVRDTGPGISPEALPRIFERFYRADPSRSGRGTGLGLAIAKHIVQAHGGEIWVESVEGQGSTFFFSVLLADAASAP